MKQDAENTAEDIKFAVDQALEGLSLPAEVTDIRVTCGEDTSGDPAIHVTLSLSPGDYDAEALRRVTDAMYTMRRRVLSLDLGRFPYFRFEQAA